MDGQPTPPNSASPTPEQPQGAKPEGLPVSGIPEQAPRGAETTPGGVEQGPQTGVGASPAPQATQAQTAQLSTDDVAAALAAVPGPNGPVGVAPPPSTAGDVDVIEPEWVDKAEDAVRAHQGDPYGEEEAVEDLQRDYLQKRYGLNVADPKA